MYTRYAGNGIYCWLGEENCFDLVFIDSGTEMTAVIRFHVNVLKWFRGSLINGTQSTIYHCSYITFYGFDIQYKQDESSYLFFVEIYCAAFKQFKLAKILSLSN